MKITIIKKEQIGITIISKEVIIEDVSMLSSVIDHIKNILLILKQSDYQITQG